jgi:hypothetical protein
VVLIDIQVSPGLQLQIEAAMLGEQLEHMIEKPDAGGNFVYATPVHSERSANFGLLGFAMDASRSH